MTTTRVAYFSAGTVGAGHLARGIAIERAIARQGVPARCAIFTVPSPYAMAEGGSHQPVAIDVLALCDRTRAKETDLARALTAFAPDLLLVDLFWAPLLHILPLDGCEAWLLLRRVPPRWLVGPKTHPYDRSLFSRVIAIEPGLDAREVDETIEPIVVCNPDERRPQGSLREALGVGRREHLDVVCQAGEAGEWRQIVDRLGTPRRPLHVLSPRRVGVVEPTAPAGVTVHDGAPFFPLAAWLDDADTITSGAGYNAYWESRWLGRQDKTSFVTFPRKIDDQEWRVRSCDSHSMGENGADVLARRLR